MADDLDENWWANDDPVREEATLPEQSEQSKKKKKSKRKVEDTKETVEEETLKKKKKKSPPERSASGKAGTAEDLNDRITKQFEGKLSPLELDEIIINDDSFLESNELHNSASSYVKIVVPKWKKRLTGMEKTKGAPMFLVVSASGQRSADLCRELKEFQMEGMKIGKLFAKHFKVEQQVTFLSKTCMSVGVGTPHRLAALIEKGALKLDNLKFIILDWNHRDAKKRRIIDIHEVRVELMNLLKNYVIPHVKRTTAKIGLM